MFDNAGDKIKKCASIMFIVIVLVVVVGIVASLLLSAHRVGVTELFLYVLLGLVGLFVAWVVSLFIYAFGSLVDDAEKCREELTEVKKQVGNLDARVYYLSQNRQNTPYQNPTGAPRV